MIKIKKLKNYGKITCGAHNFGKIADSVIRRSLNKPGPGRIYSSQVQPEILDGAKVSGLKTGPGRRNPSRSSFVSEREGDS